MKNIGIILFLLSTCLLTIGQSYAEEATTRTVTLLVTGMK